MIKYSHAIFVLMLEQDRISDLLRGSHDEVGLAVIHKKELEVLGAIQILKKGTKISLLESYLWKRLPEGRAYPEKCCYCAKKIPARTSGTWEYATASKAKYACPHHRLPKIDVKCHHCEFDKNCLEHGIRR